MSAQNIGAGKHDRAAKTLRYAIFITCGYGLLATVFFFAFAKASVGLFTSDPAVVLLGSQYLRGYICDTALAVVHFCFTGYFCAYGRADIGFIHNMAAIILLRVPGSYLASKYFAATLFPMGLAAPAGSTLSIIICAAAYWLLKRKGRFC